MAGMGIVDKVKNNVQSITGEAKSVDELAEDTDSILNDAKSDEKQSEQIFNKLSSDKNPQELVEGSATEAKLIEDEQKDIKKAFQEIEEGETEIEDIEDIIEENNDAIKNFISKFDREVTHVKRGDFTGNIGQFVVDAEKIPEALQFQIKAFKTLLKVVEEEEKIIQELLETEEEEEKEVKKLEEVEHKAESGANSEKLNKEEKKTKKEERNLKEEIKESQKTVRELDLIMDNLKREVGDLENEMRQISTPSEIHVERYKNSEEIGQRLEKAGKDIKELRHAVGGIKRETKDMNRNLKSLESELTKLRRNI